MKIKQTIVTLITIISMSGILINTAAFAATCGTDSNGNPIETSVLGCSPKPGASGVEANGVWSLLLMVINIMTAGIGVVAVAGIVYGSIMYTTSGGNPEGVKKAMGIIRNVIIGIIAYAFMYAALNFIIPGGLFK